MGIDKGGNMRQFTLRGHGLALACAFMLCGAAYSQNQAQNQTQNQPRDDSTVATAVAHKQAREIQAGDPARWHQDDASRQAALKTLQKEIGAAYDEARRGCGKGPAAQRSSCLQTARQTWQDDLKNAPDQLEAARNMGGVTTTSTVTTPATAASQ
jgi:hypothetical protein